MNAFRPLPDEGNLLVFYPHISAAPGYRRSKYPDGIYLKYYAPMVENIVENNAGFAILE